MISVGSGVYSEWDDLLVRCPFVIHPDGIHGGGIIRWDLGTIDEGIDDDNPPE
jgi:hypothetical protein